MTINIIYPMAYVGVCYSNKNGSVLLTESNNDKHAVLQLIGHVTRAAQVPFWFKHFRYFSIFLASIIVLYISL